MSINGVYGGAEATPDHCGSVMLWKLVLEFDFEVMEIDLKKRWLYI